MRRSLIAAVAAIALVAGCGDDEQTGTPLGDVEVTGTSGEPPTLEFAQPLELTESDTRILDEGDGDEVAPDTIVTFDYVFVNGRDGKELDTSYDKKPAQVLFEESLMPGIYEGLDGVPAGSEVLVGIAPGDGLDAGQDTDVQDDDTLLFYAEIHEVGPPRAEGEPVEPVDGLPTVELAEDGAPTITVPDTEPPRDLVAQPLIDGDGPDVEEEQSITVHYTGVVWDTGEVFDSSWERASPATVPIGTSAVIKGWDEGLVGQTVGSQVLLVIPPDKGYGDAGSGKQVPPDATLVFVVDILAAS